MCPSWTRPRDVGISFWCFISRHCRWDTLDVMPRLCATARHRQRETDRASGSFGKIEYVGGGVTPRAPVVLKSILIKESESATGRIRRKMMIRRETYLCRKRICAATHKGRTLVNEGGAGNRKN